MPNIIFPIHFTLQMCNLALWATLVVTFGIIKFIVPFKFLKQPLNWLITNFMAMFGIISVAIIKLFNRAEWDYRINGDLSKDNWYLLTSNHLSYLDIILLIEFTAKRIPSPKFFLKQELIWLPFVGVAAWALEMPFMQRYSRAFIEKNPHLKGKDIETTRKHCSKFKNSPTTIINFVEGTRFNPQKKALKKSSFENLLPPKAGGIAFTFAAMGELFTNVIDVTLVYPKNQRGIMMDLLCGRLEKVIFHVDVLPMTDELIGDYFNDDEFRESFQSNLNQRWLAKDAKITALLAEQ